MDYKVKIDSCKIRYPLSVVSFVDINFAKKYQKVFIHTGEIEDFVNLEKHKVHEENGIRTRIAIIHGMDGTEAGAEFLEIQINAKMLKEAYFRGITLGTIGVIHKYIQHLKIINIKYSDFLQGMISDYDFCLDFPIKRKVMGFTNQKCYSKIKPTYYRYVRSPLDRKDNTGISFNERSKATPSKPHSIIYHKSTELLYQSNVFCEKYLQKSFHPDIGRIEFTVKNAKHRKYLKITEKTLYDTLKISQKRMKKILMSGHKKYTMTNQIMREYSELTPSDKLLLVFINRTIDKGADKQNIISALEVFDVPQEKSRMRKKLLNIITNVDDNLRMVSNRESMEMMRILEMNFDEKIDDSDTDS